MTTRLQAVNQLLSSIGESPINQLEAPLPSDASLASDKLDEITSAIQNRRWWFKADAAYLAFDDLPESAKRYVVIKASRLLRATAMSSLIPPGYSMGDEAEAWHNLRSEHIRSSNVNIFDTDGPASMKLWRNNNGLGW